MEPKHPKFVTSNTILKRVFTYSPDVKKMSTLLQNIQQANEMNLIRAENKSKWTNKTNIGKKHSITDKIRTKRMLYVIEL